MSREHIPIPVPQRHVDRNAMSDWVVIGIGDEPVIIHEPTGAHTSAYTIANTTRNPRVIATADAVMWEGDILTPYYHDGNLTLTHPWIGNQVQLAVEPWLDERVVLLAQTDLVRLKGVGGRVSFECIDCGEHIERERHQMDIPGLTPSRCTSCTFDKMGGRA